MKNPKEQENNIGTKTKYGNEWCLLPDCKNHAGHDGYYCEDHHSKYYFGKTDTPNNNQQENTMRERFDDWCETNMDREMGSTLYVATLDFIEKETALARNQAIQDCIECVEKLDRYDADDVGSWSGGCCPTLVKEDDGDCVKLEELLAKLQALSAIQEKHV